MSKEETVRFVSLWNAKHEFPDGPSTSENMRYVAAGVVCWNSYDSPYIDLEEFLDLIQKAKGTK